jgi:ribonuclease D
MIRPAVHQSDIDVVTLGRLGHAKQLAWDIETTGLDWRSGEIGTCQVAAPGIEPVIVKVDPASPPRRLLGLIEDPAIGSVFHHAMFDLRWLVGHYDIVPANVECTKVASKILFGREATEGHSLKDLLAMHLSVDIDKSQRLSDWTSETLSAEQTVYAAADVVYLHSLLETLERQLEAAGLQEVYRECARFIPTNVYLQVNAWPDVFSY